MKPREERLAEQIRLTELLPQVKTELMAYPGVRDVGVGLREKDDVATDEIVFRVYVTEKKKKSALPAGALIRKEILGVRTDVVIEPVPKQTSDEEKYRPLQGGIQIGNDTTSFRGTLGCIAQLNGDHSVVLLSTAHAMVGGGAKIGEKIGQPAISCCCCCKGNIVAKVREFKYDALVDCAIADIVGQPGFVNEIQDIGLVFGSAPLNGGGSTVVVGDLVRKRGRATGLTTGRVVNVSKSTPAVTDPENPIPARTNQIEIKPEPGFEWFQLEGDSGAVLVNADNVVVGLMWGVDKTTKLSHANRITDVLAALPVTIPFSGTAGTLPLGAVPSAEELSGAGIADEPLREMERILGRSETGRRALALFHRHGHEINDLLKTNREVKVAWHRFHGPEFTAHVIESARERDHAIPANIEGVSPANLLIRMSVVLQENGSPALAAAIEANTLPVLQLFATARTVHDLLEHFEADGEELEVAGITSPESGLTVRHG